MADDKLHEAMLWEKERNGIRCGLCARKCFIGKGKYGFCDVRKNEENQLYTMNYGKLTNVSVDPMEKKPLFHFFPNSKTLSISSFGCNFKCQFCDNWEISQQTDKYLENFTGKTYTPEDVVKQAEDNNCKSISYTYNEPTMFFEFVHDTAKLAKRNNLMNVFVTNGYMEVDALKKISKYIDAAVVNIKASLDPEFYKKFMSVPDVSPIYETMRQLKRQRIFFEITNLIVPQLGDSTELCGKFAEHVNANLGSAIPIHILRFHPDYQLMDLPPTPVPTLERCMREMQMRGLRYIYIGNVDGHDDENTYCYNCREMVIKRSGTRVEEINLIGDRCYNCGFKIDVIVE